MIKCGISDLAQLASNNCMAQLKEELFCYFLNCDYIQYKVLFV